MIQPYDVVVYQLEFIDWWQVDNKVDTKGHICSKGDLRYNIHSGKYIVFIVLLATFVLTLTFMRKSELVRFMLNDSNDYLMMFWSGY